jgi:hypothetical protein
MSDPTTVDAALADALEAYASLGELGEEVDDEWTYVTELGAAWRDRLEAVADARAGEPLDPTVATAVEAVIDEIARIDDPHRAIDWLSTFPQVVLLALGEPA